MGGWGYWILLACIYTNLPSYQGKGGHGWIQTSLTAASFEHKTGQERNPKILNSTLKCYYLLTFMSTVESSVWCQNLETSLKKSKNYQYLYMLDKEEEEEEGRGEEGGRRGTGEGEGRRWLSFLFVVVENTLVIWSIFICYSFYVVLYVKDPAVVK